MAQNGAELSPGWLQLHMSAQATLGDVPSPPLAELEDTCRQVVHEAVNDSNLHPRVAHRAQSKWRDYASSAPSSRTKRALRILLESIPPVPHHCDVCHKCRLVMERPKPWVPFECGSEQSLYPERSCQSNPDEPYEWLACEEGQGLLPKTEPLHVLAMAAERVSMEEVEQSRQELRQQQLRSQREASLGIKQSEACKRKRSGRRRLHPIEGISLPGASSGQEQTASEDHRLLQGRLAREMAGLDLFNVTEKGQPGLAPLPQLRKDVLQTPIASPTGSAELDPCTPAKKEQDVRHPDPSPIPQRAAPANLYDSIQPDSGAKRQFDFRLQDATFARLVNNVADRSTVSALGRAISDPQVLQRELDKGIPPLEEDEPVKVATAAAVLRSGVDCSAYTPGRPLSRAISDPRKMQHAWGRNAADAAAQKLGINLPARISLIPWQAVVRYEAQLKSLDLFTLVAAIPSRVANVLPAIIPVSGIRTRDSIRMDTILEEPLLLRLGKIDATQKHAVEQMERHKIAVIAQFPAYDLVLVPHMNTRECLHIIGLRMEKSGNLQNQQLPPSVLPLQRTLSAMPALDVEQLNKKTYRATPSRRKPKLHWLESIPEDSPE